jgi:hypothetical protein
MLRERGIYRLPDGQELVVTECSPGKYCAYTVRAWRAFGLAEFLLSEGGEILKGGGPTGWRVEDLSDTGETAQQYVTDTHS